MRPRGTSAVPAGSAGDASTDPIVPGWVDAFGMPRVLSPEARAAVESAIGVRSARRGAAAEPVLLGSPGERLAEPAELTLEDGTNLGRVDALPADLPFGYHVLRRDAGEQLVIAAPPRCVVPRGYRAWGWAVQVHATRSERSWGIGDLGDLRELAAWSRSAGAEAMVTSPLGAPNPGRVPEPSPYYPSSRRFRSPLLIRVEEVPGADHPAVGLPQANRDGRALNATAAIDREQVQRLKLAVLERTWATGAALRDDAAAALAAFRYEQGSALRAWAIFAALSERFGPGWRRWPEEYRAPQSAALDRFAAAAHDRVAFHEWLQWLADLQLERAAAAGVRLISDLPIGFDPGGFDAWAWQATIAQGATVGAPPDRFNPLGQDWGLPPFIPHRLREERLRPFIDTVRAVLRHAGGLRIDHVLGLFRLWWIPGGLPSMGAYVRYPADELLAVLALESHRAGALIVGEDLGTVEPGVRRALARRGLLSTRLVYFERRAPAAYPRRALAAVTTHDLPTVAGAWSGTDASDLRAAGLVPDLRAQAILRGRVARAGRTASSASVPEAILAVYAALAASPACLVSATLEDALRVEERPNVPGTTARQRSNWSQALPLPLEAIERDPFVNRLAETMRRS